MWMVVKVKIDYCKPALKYDIYLHPSTVLFNLPLSEIKHKNKFDR